MANKTLEALATQVQSNISAEESAVTVINGIAQRVQDAVNKAIEGGATAEDLAPVQAEVDSLKASSDKLSAAIAASTPGV